MNNSWERNRNLCLLIGIATIAIGSIFMMTGIALNNVNFIEAAKWLMAIGLSLISIGIACHAVVISNKSDEKMIAIANADFIEIIQNFREYGDKCSIRKNDDITSYHERNDIIKWHIDLKKANLLKTWVVENRQLALSIAVQELLKTFPWGSKLLSDDDIGHILAMCRNVVKFKMLDEKNLAEILGAHKINFSMNGE